MSLPSYYRMESGLPDKLQQRCTRCGIEKRRRREHALCQSCADRERHRKRKASHEDQSAVFLWPETLDEYMLRRDLPSPDRDDPYAIVKNLNYPPSDMRRYGAVKEGPD